MRVEVVNTGTELLLGKVLNTHAGYIGQELFKLGLRIQRQTTIPDGDEIRTVLAEAFPRTDIIVITGGLGPTSDDITREVVAEMLGRELHLDQEILDEINDMFVRRGYQMNRSNDRQAMVPEGAIVLDNPNGTAPGLYLPACEEQGSPHLFLLPGPPRELKPMFSRLVYPRLAEMRQSELHSHVWRNFRIYGVGESSLAAEIEPRLEGMADLELGYCARLGEVDLRLIGPESVVDAASEIVRQEYAEDIIAESEDSIEQVILELLLERGETVSTAESCTGGQIVSTLTNVSGSSAILKQGYVTYANSAKTEILGVPAELIEEHGAVSDEVVRAMAEGCLRVSGADHAVAVSGVAGPTGGSEEKPVGTVYIGIASKGMETYSKRHFTPADRFSFKLRVTRLVLDMLRRRLCGFSLEK
ncbi:MAG: competence/damage-inducible protein A [Verrucomicrobiales bacterium]|nr:competence/damage-inducible protein A [Verrucomicrobiales bacterium]